MRYPENKYILLLITGLLIAACEREVANIKLPGFRQKLVVTSFISPRDTSVNVLVTSNRKIFGELNNEEPLGSLSGTFSDGINVVSLKSTREDFIISTSELVVSPGKKYTIKIRSDNGLEAEGSCTVPLQKNFSVKIDTFRVYHQVPDPVLYSYTSLEFMVTITDFRGEKNYYRISGRSVDYITDRNTGNTFTVTNEPWFDEEFFSDDHADGGEIIRKTDFGNPADHYSYDSAFFEIVLFNTDMNYYLYHSSLERYEEGDNPFSEVSPVFSNINGGLGVFAAYTVDSLRFRIK